MLTRFRTAVFHLVLWMKLGCSQQSIRMIDQNQPMRSQSKDKQITWGAGNWRQWTSCQYFRCLAGHTVAFTYHLPSQNFMKKSSICQKKILPVKACPEERTPLTGTFCWPPFVPSLQWQLVVAAGMDPGSWRLDDGAQQLGPREKVCQEKGA